MFRSRIVSSLFPFPEEIGDSFHDNWIGCVSFLFGTIKYIDLPLYDYYQHSGNVIGHDPLPGVQSDILGKFRNLTNRKRLEKTLQMDLEFYNTYGVRRQALAICLVFINYSFFIKINMDLSLLIKNRTIIV